MLCGCDQILDYDLKGRIALVCNQASHCKDYVHLADKLFSNNKLHLLFGPQHGIRGEQQDNMIESAHFKDSHTGVKVYSLYSETREITEQMSTEFDILLYDLVDVGSRYYTFLTTMVNCMAACQKYKKKMYILDRPNPIGSDIEGNYILSGFKSFVGALSIPNRHGMTLGELAYWAMDEMNIHLEIEIVKVKNWDRNAYLTGVTWIMPSPNMPTVDTAIVYPGACLIEGTNLSEGRGTTKPFEYIGAPFINPYELKNCIDSMQLKGCYFREIYFKPTFNKWADKVCGGIHVIVTDKAAFKPYRVYISLLKCIRLLYTTQFEWKQPPYEYDYVNLPFDILTGNPLIRKAIDGEIPFESVEKQLVEDESNFKAKRQKYLQYS